VGARVNTQDPLGHRFAGIAIVAQFLIAVTRFAAGIIWVIGQPVAVVVDAI
jgi:hypothetical protein